MSRHPDREAWFRGSNVTCEPTPFPRKRTYRLVLLGPPDVGKVAQAELLSAIDWEAAIWQRVTCSEKVQVLLRLAPSWVATRTAMRDGELISDELVISIVRERSACLRC